MRWIRLISTNINASPISRKYALLHTMMFALDRRVELIAGPMTTTCLLLKEGIAHRGTVSGSGAAYCDF
jgi:hypothetical protein